MPHWAWPRWLKGDLHCHTLHSDGLELRRGNRAQRRRPRARLPRGDRPQHEHALRGHGRAVAPADRADSGRRGDDVLGAREHVGPARVDRLPLRRRGVDRRRPAVRAPEGRADLGEPPEVHRAAVAVQGLGGLSVDGGLAGAVAVLQLGVAGALGRAAAQGRARRRRRRLGRALDPAGGAAPPARPREPDDVGLRRADRGVGPRRASARATSSSRTRRTTRGSC